MTCRRRSASPACRRSCAGRAGPAPAPTACPGGWDVRQRHAHPDVAATQGGHRRRPGERRHLALAGAGRGRDPGRLAGRRARRRATSTWRRSRSRAAAPAAEAFLALVEGRTDLAPGGSLGLDPLGVQAAGGEAQDLSGLADLARRAAAHPGLRTVVVDATVFHDAGGSAVEELGCSLAAGVAYLRALTEGGLSVDEAFGQLEFRYAASADQFTTIAALRAARRLWDRVGEASGASPEARAQRQHAVTSSVMTTRHDPWVNMLRDDGRLLRRGGGRRRRRHRAAVRRRARPARRVLPADRPQHPEPAGRGGPPRPRARPGRRLLVRRVAHRGARAGRLGLVHRDRAGRRAAARRWTSGLVRDRLGAAWDERATAARPPHRRDHRRQRVPEPGRGAARAASRPPRCAVRAGRAAPGARGAGVRGPARPRPRRRTRAPRSTWPPSGPVARHTARADVRRQPVPGRRPRRRRRATARSGLRARPGRRSPASAAPTRTTRESRGRAGRGAAARPARRRSGWPGSRRGGRHLDGVRRLRLRRLRRAGRPARRSTSSWECSR